MLKTLLLVLAGLAAGLAIAFWLQPSAAPPLTDAATTRRSAAPAVPARRADGGASAARLAALEDAFAAEVEQRAALEERVAELAAELEALGERRGAGCRRADRADGAPDPARDRAERARVLAPTAAPRAKRSSGARSSSWSPAASRRIAPSGSIRRTQELRMQALQAQYDATREGRAFEPGAALGGERTLRSGARRRRVRAIPAGATAGRRACPCATCSQARRPSARACKPGDEIVAYGGKRVFDMRELNAMTLEGTPGESVVVEVRRDGQNVQLVMPRGPLGITGGGFRGR